MRKCIVFLILTSFLTNMFVPHAYAQAVLPSVGERMALSSAFAPALLQGIKVDVNDPLRLDFILDRGDQALPSNADADRLIKYFLAALTVPEKDLWVNLSPYEKDRIIPQGFGQTGMGRDLLAQDYILKQITASVIYPEAETGKAFWSKVYAEAEKRYGTTDIPIDTFNKVWIVPSRAKVYENKGAAYVIESRLKVMLESDYLAMDHNGVGAASGRPSSAASGRPEVAPTQTIELTGDILREIIIPILEKEVNEGAHFATLRQVYHSLILASWYKRKIKDSLLSAVYADQNKVSGVNIEDLQESEKIWAQYVVSFKKGVYNFVREETDVMTGEVIPRKYFSGGANFDLTGILEETNDAAQLNAGQGKKTVVQVMLSAVGGLLDRKKPVTGWNTWNWPEIRMALGLAQDLQEKEDISRRIVASQRLVMAGVGDKGRFRKSADIEVLLPDLKKRLEIFLPGLPRILQGRLMGVLPSADDDMVDRVKILADRLAVEAGGNLLFGNASLAEAVRDGIHNRPSAQDLMAVEAYRDFVISNGLRGKRMLYALGYYPNIGDAKAFLYKKDVALACDDLLAGLREIYGPGSFRQIEGVLQGMGNSAVLQDQWQTVAKALAEESISEGSLRIIEGMRSALSARMTSASGQELYALLRADGLLRAVVYRVSNDLRGFPESWPVLVPLLIRDIRLSGYEQEMAGRLESEFLAISSWPEGRTKDLRIHALLRRVERLLKKISAATSDEYQPLAREISMALGVKRSQQGIVDDLSANMLRADSVYLLSLAETDLKRQLRASLGIADWQVAAEGVAAGVLHYAADEKELARVKPGEILVVDELPGEDPVLSRAAGIIVLSEDSLLSHPAILARQNGIPFVVAPDKEAVSPYLGKTVVLTVEGDVVTLREGVLQENVAGVRERKVEIPEARTDGSDIVLPQEYTPATVGMKAFNLKKIDAIRLAAGQRTARHVALSFALAEQPELLHEKIGDISRAIRQQIPQGQVFLRSSTNAEDLPGYAGAGLYDSFGAVDPDDLDQLEAYIRKVWASVNNERAVADRDRNGIDHQRVKMSVLVHEMVDAQYSYVVHTVDPRDQGADRMVVEIVEGFGESLVSGSPEYQGASHRFVLDRKTGEITRLGYADKDHRLVLKDGKLVRESTDYQKDIFAGQDIPAIVRKIFEGAGSLEDGLEKKGWDIEGCLTGEAAQDIVFVQARDQQGLKAVDQFVGLLSKTDAAQLMFPQGVNRVLDVNGLKVRIMVDPGHAPGNFKVNILPGDDVLKGSFYLKDDGKVLQVSSFYPLGDVDDLLYKEYRGRGVGDAVIAWLADEAFQAKRTLSNSGTMTLPLVRVYLKYFGDEIQRLTSPIFENAAEFIKENGFYSSKLWGRIDVRTEGEDESQPAKQSFKLTRAGAQGDFYVVSDLWGDSSLQDGQIIDIRSGRIYLENGEKTGLYINKGYREVFVRGKPRPHGKADAAQAVLLTGGEVVLQNADGPQVRLDIPSSWGSEGEVRVSVFVDEVKTGTFLLRDMQDSLFMDFIFPIGSEGSRLYEMYKNKGIGDGIMRWVAEQSRVLFDGRIKVGKTSSIALIHLLRRYFDLRINGERFEGIVDRHGFYGQDIWEKLSLIAPPADGLARQVKGFVSLEKISDLSFYKVVDAQGGVFRAGEIIDLDKGSIYRAGLDGVRRERVPFALGWGTRQLVVDGVLKDAAQDIRISPENVFVAAKGIPVVPGALKKRFMRKDVFGFVRHAYYEKITAHADRILAGLHPGLRLEQVERNGYHLVFHIKDKGYFAGEIVATPRVSGDLVAEDVKHHSFRNRAVLRSAYIALNRALGAHDEGVLRVSRFPDFRVTRDTESGEDVALGILFWDGLVKEGLAKRKFLSYAMLREEALSVSVPEASAKKGGIDLNAVDRTLDVEGEVASMPFHVRPDILAQYRSASGFSPVIIGMEPLADLPAFLGAQ